MEGRTRFLEFAVPPALQITLNCLVELTWGIVPLCHPENGLLDLFSRTSSTSQLCVSSG